MLLSDMYFATYLENYIMDISLINSQDSRFLITYYPRNEKLLNANMGYETVKNDVEIISVKLLLANKSL